MARSRTLRKLSLTLANLLLPIAVLVFATGFFPYKPVLPGLATWEEMNVQDSMTREDAPFDRVVFMVVDALRSDFVYGRGSEMGFAQRYGPSFSLTSCSSRCTDASLLVSYAPAQLYPLPPMPLRPPSRCLASKR